MGDSSTQSSKLTSPRVQKLLLYVLGISLICLLLFFGMVFLVRYLDNQPQYIEVSIDLPGEKDWFYADQTIRTWDDGPKYFIWRRETTVYKDAPDNFETQQSVVDFIDRQLVDNGWKRAYYSSWYPCNPIMPESTFLERGTTYLEYKKGGTIKFETGTPTLCLAVWPIENVDGFHVLLMTGNPSRLTQLQEMFDQQ